MNQLLEAMRLVAVMMDDMTDKTGQPFLGHPLRVAARLAGQWDDDVVSAALLHDIVEDTNVTFDDLYREGFEGEVVALVDALTRRPDEQYRAYVERVYARGVMARAIKRADLEDNLDARRCFPGCESLDRRHRRALHYINTGGWPS